MRLLDERELLETETSVTGLYPPEGVVAGTRWASLDEAHREVAVLTWMYQNIRGEHLRQITFWRLDPEACGATCHVSLVRLPEDSEARATGRVPKRHVQMAKSLLRHFFGCKRTRVRVELTGEQVRSANKVHLSVESSSPRVPVIDATPSNTARTEKKESEDE